MAARGFLGAGDLYIARYNATLGAFEDFDGPFEATQFEIQPNSELKEMSSRGRSTYGQVIESVPLPQPSDFSVTLAEVNKDSLALALFGTASTLSTGAGTMTAVEVTAKLGKWVEIGHANIVTTGFTVTEDEDVDPIVYVLGTDYEINYRIGMIRVLSAGAITENQVLRINGTYNAINGTSIAGGTQTQLRAKFKLDGVNFADQLPVIVDVWEAVLTPEGAFDFLQNEFAEIALSGRLKTPTGKTEPFQVVLRDA